MKLTPSTRGFWQPRLWSTGASPLDSAFRQFAEAFSDFAPQTRTERPALNVRETDDTYVVEAVVPGYALDDLDVTFEGDSLRIAGKSVHARNESDSAHRRERFVSEFARTLRLPDPVRTDGIDAQLQNGVLVIELPKREEAKPRRISVRATGA